MSWPWYAARWKYAIDKQRGAKIALCRAIRLLTAMLTRLKQAQQRVAVVDPETRISFLFARCRPTRSHAVALTRL